MTRHEPRYSSGLLPHSIVTSGSQVPDDEKTFRAANASYRAIRALGAALLWRPRIAAPSANMARLRRRTPAS